MAKFSTIGALKTKLVNNVSDLSLFIDGSKVEVLYTNTAEAQSRIKSKFHNHFCDLPTGTNETKARNTALNAMGVTS